MAVPAHDERDYSFARRYGIPVVEVVAPGGVPRGVEDGAVVADGILISSGEFSGLESGEARVRMAARAELEGFGRAVVRYRIRDWLVSRQRYWGAPVPIIHCPACGAVPDRNLPVLLPEVDRYEPDDTGRSPLARAGAWVATTCPSCGGPASRDTNTMAGFACSSWYFLRFASPFEKDRPFDPEAVKYWLPVDLYVGGAEHAVMHLLYARFWTKVMHDAGMLDFTEPFTVLKNQGMLLGRDHQKMSKSKGNVVTPDEMAERYGVDALRLYILFMGPFEADLEWSEEGIAGTCRFLKRLWGLVLDSAPSGGGGAGIPDPGMVRELRFQTAKTVKKVTQDVDAFQFNTAVASLMEMVNFMSAGRSLSVTAPGEWRRSIRDMLVLLAPMTPFISEELWRRTGLGEGSIHSAGWPSWDEADLARDEVEIAVQIAGKVRAHVMMPSGSSDEAVRAAALGLERIRELLAGGEPRKVIVVPGRLVNIIP
jgi:leucyl-tRNA synthetase